MLVQTTDAVRVCTKIYSGAQCEKDKDLLTVLD